MLYLLDLVERLEKCAIEVFEFDVSFEVRKALKYPLFANFLDEMTHIPLEPNHTWLVFTEGSSNSKGSDIGVILENKFG